MVRSPNPAHAAARQRWLAQALADDGDAGLLRRLRTRDGGSAVVCVVDGREVVMASSNDYLGLSVHPAVRRAAAEAALAGGVGATGSRHLSGCHRAVADLEAEVAGFEGSETATLAPSGYAANVSVLQALGGEDATLYSDARNHASLVDGCRLSRARVEVFGHRDLGDLAHRLTHGRGRPVIVSDTIFSVDGTVADVAGLAGLAARHDAWLVLDEAHATGVLGPGGRGVGAAAELGDLPGLVRVITFSKALGAGGAAVCADEPTRQLLLQRGRALMFSTGLPHPTVAAARAALGVLRQDPGLVERLGRTTGRLRRALGPLGQLGDVRVPIVPVPAGDASRALRMEQALFERGFLVQALRPPTVPPGTSRLRLVASAAHSEEQIDALALATREVCAGGG